MIKILYLLLVTVSLTCGAGSVSGLEFHATKNCPAYVSKNKKTNPDNLFTQSGIIYPVVEINKPSPDWFRLKIGVNEDRRWVSAACGDVENNGQDSSACDVRGQADSQVLALSAQPGFCETYGFEAGKPECLELKKNSYQASHLTLHGLWPNKDLCGTHYGFCAVKPLASHCAYEPLVLLPEVSQQLKKLMPSFYYGSCLERHEWTKHGSCQNLTVDEYFSLAMRLASEADSSPVGQYLTSHQGQTVKLSELRQVVRSAFGTEHEGKIYFGCKNKVLVDVYIQLPETIHDEDSLVSLVTQAPNNHFRDQCAQDVKISEFNKETWL